jgi:DNA-binding transcriptional MerR regulator/ketosteroid isomerase-like protein
MKMTAIGPRAVSQATGVSTDTLRHYERLGLLPPTERTRAGYRRYDPAVIARVELIQRALVVGFSLKDLAAVLKRRESGEPPCRAVRRLVGDRLDVLERRLADLTRLRNELRRLLEDWDVRLAATSLGQRARLLDMLEGRAAFDGTRSRGSLSRRVVAMTRRPPPEELHTAFQRAFNRQDLDETVALYEREAVLIRAGETVMGSNRIRETYREVFASRPRLTLETSAVHGSGDLAVLHGRWHWVGQGPSGRAIQNQGRSIEVVRLQPDGRWLFVIDDPFTDNRRTP